jgi:chemotaxis protein MotA
LGLKQKTGRLIMDDLKKRSVWGHAKKNILGLMFCIVLFCAGFIIHGHIGLYLNLSGFIIVIGGTFGATLVSYRMERLMILIKVLFTSYGKELRTPDDIVEILVDLSVKRRLKGLLSLQRDEEETTIVFLRQALGFMVDGYNQAQIREVLNAEMYFFRMRRDETTRVLQTMADVAPAFGLVGSVVGLIGMLAGVGDSAVIMSTVPIALTSTLYGIVLANFFFLPFVANIRERTVQELMLKKIITEGVIAIAGDLHPRMLERKLKSFLTPSARKGDLISLEKIRQKFEVRDGEEGFNGDESARPVEKLEPIEKREATEKQTV